ncbi:MAG: sphingomyelin phosphodiesterase [Paludibacter sp.]|jgi:endonuclease/exonuclease/phosphatase family metal-dependent hydrolase|nr:sphingomyelin phosphodiesterase [Paludibacter sp.]
MNTVTASDSSPLRILSWNVYLLPVLSLFNDNPLRARAIADEIYDSNYDVVVFQEAFSATNRRRIARRIREKYPFQYGPVNQGRALHRTNSGLWIVSRIPLTLKKSILFSESTGFDAVARKGAVIFEGEFKGKKFQLLTTHLQADGKPGIRERQLEEIRQQLLHPYSDVHIPQVICGDFNIEKSDSSTYDGMLRVLEAADGELSSSLRYSYDERGNSLLRRPEGNPKLIDYILLRNDGLIHRIERKIRAFQRLVGEEMHHLSDHYALEAEIHLY